MPFKVLCHNAFIESLGNIKNNREKSFTMMPNVVNLLLVDVYLCW